jgi:hypothetical protein
MFNARLFYLLPLCVNLAARSTKETLEIVTCDDATVTDAP